MYEIVGIEYEFTCLQTLKSWAYSYGISMESIVAQNGDSIGKLADFKIGDCGCKYCKYLQPKNTISQ